MEFEKAIIENAFIGMCEYYSEMLGNYYPAYGKNGFTERNLTFNFCHNLLVKNKNLIVFQEVPIKNKQHFDSIVIDDKNKVVFIIEAKRLQSKKKMSEIADDCDRMLAHFNEFNGHEERKNYKKWCIILIDLWIPRNEPTFGTKKRLRNAFMEYEPNKEIEKKLFNLKEIKKKEGNISNSEDYYLLYKAFCKSSSLCDEQ